MWYPLGVKIVRTTPTKQNSGTFKGFLSKFPMFRCSPPSLLYGSSLRGGGGKSPRTLGHLYMNSEFNLLFHLFFFSLVLDWPKRRGIISTNDAADSKNSTSTVRKNSTKKSRQQAAKKRELCFTLGLVYK